MHHDLVHPDPLPMLRSDQIAAILAAARRSDEAPALLLRIAALLPCDAAAIANARIEDVDRRRGTLTVPDPDGRPAEVVLGFEAAKAVQAAIGGRWFGLLVPDPTGGALTVDDAEDYAREIVSIVDPACAAIPWTFRLLRESIFAELLEFGTPPAVAEAQAGIRPACVGWSADDLLFGQRGAADWWTYRLGLRPPAAFLLVAAASSADRRRR